MRRSMLRQCNECPHLLRRVEAVREDAELALGNRDPGAERAGLWKMARDLLAF